MRQAGMTVALWAFAVITGSAAAQEAHKTALMQWIDKGTKPTAQSIAAGCEQLRASLDGPCRYRPEYAPQPYATRYYTREAAVR